MTKVFHIRALNSPNGDFREVELDLPATDYVLLDAMEQLRLEDGKRPYLEFRAAEEYDYLNKRIQEADIFRLNALAKRLAELDMRGMAVFEGLVCMAIRKGGGTIPIGSLIDYAYSGECCHVVEDILTDEELGVFLVENGFIPEAEDLSDKALELLDCTRIGKTHREAKGGAFTSFGYVERHSELCQVYKTLDFTPKQPAHTILAATFDGDRVAFPFPANIPMGTEPVCCVDCAVPSLIGLTGGMETVDLLARRLANMNGTDLCKFKALAEAVCCRDLSQAKRLLSTLEEYLFSPEYRTPAEAAEGELAIILDERAAALIRKHLNLQRYGEDLLRQRNTVLTSYGLIERRDGQPMQSMEVQPAQGGIEGVIGMGTA